jgi:hypothetical protein
MVILILTITDSNTPLLYSFFFFSFLYNLQSFFLFGLHFFIHIDKVKEREQTKQSKNQKKTPLHSKSLLSVLYGS